ncbi:MAG: ribonuclease H-like domain-containing protein [Spirochaetes bacterium]|nr:ribonuclease H-like domain-containing protein [Spirochaetota bacterium]MBN2769813.1 ribonuclease H-like domain-containing protein [Spirochaetota bacterium]
MSKENKYIVFDIESVPDGKLIKDVKYPGEDISEDEAISRLQDEIMDKTAGKSNFIPVTMQYPVSVVVALIAEDLTINEIKSLDYGNFRASEISRSFWFRVEVLDKKASLVTFNGRGFDVPLMELMAYRYGHEMKRHLTDKFGTRFRFGTRHIDLQDFIGNYNAIGVFGGLNMLAKTIGLPGKTDTAGDQVYDLYREGKIEQINDYCIHDVLDTYLVFLRTRVMLGDITLDDEKRIRENCFTYLKENCEYKNAAESYLSHIKDFEPWP